MEAKTSQGRKPVSWIARGFFGCGAIAIGALAALIALAPRLAASFVPRFAERNFGERYRGSIDVESVSLSWLKEVELGTTKLFDPEGQLVAQAKGKAPSLWALLRTRGKVLAPVRLEVEADLRALDDGTTNLERALEPRVVRLDRDGSGNGKRTGEEDLQLDVEIVCPRVTWEDARTRARGERLELRNLTASVRVHPGSPLELLAKGSFMPPSEGSLDLRAVIERPFADLDAPEPPQATAELVVDEFPPGLIDALSGGGALSGNGIGADEILGAAVSVRASANGTPKQGELSLRIEAERLKANLRGSFRDNVLYLSSIDPAPVAQVGKEAFEAIVQRYVAEALPAGSSLSVAGDSPCQVELEEVSLPAALFSRPSDAPADAVAPLSQVRGLVRVAIPELSYADQAGWSVAFGPGVVVLDPGEGEEIKLQARIPIVGPEAGSIEAEAVARGLTTLDPAALETASIACTARFERVPTAPLDALLEQDGLLVDVLGPSLSGDLTGSWPLEDAQDLRANLSSAIGRVSLEADLQEDALVATGDQGLRASLSLTPLFSQRIVGNLVPLLVDLQKEPSDPPVALSVSNFKLPLKQEGGNEEMIRSIAADVTIELGEIAYRFLPGLEGSLGSAIDSFIKPQKAEIPPIVLRVENGVVSYAELPLAIDGKPLTFSGRYDIVQHTFQLTGELPLKYLGGTIAKNLDQAREFLDPDLAVPITLSGTLSKPSLTVRGDFLDGLIEDALSNTLQRGLERLLRKKN